MPPIEYMRMRDRLVAQGKPYDEAQRISAATFNKRHPNNPMGPKEDRRDMPHHQRMASKRRRKK